MSDGENDIKNSENRSVDVLVNVAGENLILKNIDVEKNAGSSQHCCLLRNER